MSSAYVISTTSKVEKPKEFPSATVALFSGLKISTSILSPDLSDFVHPGVLISCSAWMTLTTLHSTYKTPTASCDVSSVYERESDSLCIPHVQDLPSNSISDAIYGTDPPIFLIAPSFFSYWFDGFWPSQCLCALIILIILSDDQFYDVVPKVRLSKYLKETIYSLDLASMTAEPRAAKSDATNHSEYQFVDLRSSKGPGFSKRLRPSKMSTSGTAADLRTTHSLNSA
jgi:hypothetical protein